VVRRAPVGVEPAAPADAARGHSPARDLEGVQDARVKRALHVHRTRHPIRAADCEVAGAVDRKAFVSGQRLGQHVGEQALGQAAGVELDAGGARNARHARIHVELAPTRPLPCRGGRAPRRERQRELQRQRPAQVAHVAAVLDLVEQRTVDQPSRAQRRQHHSFGQSRHQRTDHDGVARVLVEQRQLAVGQKARELVVPFPQAALRKIGGIAGAAPRGVACHQHLTRGAEALKRTLCLHVRAHDCEVVTADGLLLGLLDDEPLDDSCAEEPEPSELELDDADCVLVAAALVVLVPLRSDELEVAAALRLAAEASAGSCPETSCT